MEAEGFPALAVAMRRQLALLSAKTYTDERRKIIELILRLSFDCHRLEAAVPSQEWIARQEGVHESNVSKVLSALRDFGILSQRRGADNWILFEPRPDAARWAGQYRGEALRWRIEDGEARRQALNEEMRLASVAHAGAPEQILLGYEVEPTIREEFQEALASTHRQEACDRAGFLPDPNPSAQERPRRDFAGLKAKISGKPVGSPTNLAADGLGSPAKSTPNELGSPAKSSQPSWSTNQVEGLPQERRVGSPAKSPPKTAGLPTEQLVGQPSCPRASASASAPARPSPISPSSPSLSLQLTSLSISPSEMGQKDAAGAAEERDGQMGEGTLPERIRALIGEKRWHEWQRWLRWELGKSGGREAALDAFGELKIQQDLAANGHRQTIHTPGAWWLSKFRLLTGHQRRPPRSHLARQPPG